MEHVDVNGKTAQGLPWQCYYRGMTDDTTPTGKAFQVDPSFDRSERMRLDLPGIGEDNHHFTWWDDTMFVLALPLCIIGIVGGIAMFLYSWLA